MTASPPQPPAVSPPAPSFRSVRARPLALGVLSDSDVSYQLNLSEQPNCLIAVAGSSGSGKTEFLRSLASRLLSQEIPVLLFDLHGDLKLSGVPSAVLKAGSGFDPVVVLRELKLPARRAIFRQLLPTIGYLQEEQLQELLQQTATLPELLKKLSAFQGPSAAGLRAAFDRTFSDPGFHSAGFDLSHLGTSPLRIDLSELSRPAQPLAVSLLLLLLFERLRGAGPTTKPGVLRTFVVLDEAAALKSEEILDILAREARKFGLGAAIASQSVRHLSADVLGNAATTCCFRLLTRPEAALVEKAVPGMQAATLNSLRAPGEALIRDRNGVQRVQMARAPAGKKR